MAAAPTAGIAANNPILNPNATLSGPALLQAAQGLASAQVSPAIQQLAQEIAQNNQQTAGAEKLTGGYFNQLGQQAQQGLTDQQGISSNLQSQLAGIQANENSQLQGIGQNAQDMFNKYAPGSAANGNPGLSALTSEIARQQGLAAQGNAAFSNFGANQGANFQNLAASNLGTFASKGQEALSNIAQAGQIRNQPLTGKLATENATYGADLATALGKLRQQEITNQISDAGLGIKAQTAANTVADNVRTTQTSAQNNQRTTAASIANNQRTNATSRANNAANNNPAAVGSPAWARVQAAQGKAWSDNPSAVGSPAWAKARTTGAGGGGKPLSTLENNHFWGTVGQIEQLIKDGQAHGQQGKIAGYLQSGQNPSKKAFDPFMIRVADELLGYGSINQSTAATLHNQYGVRGGTYNGQPIKVTPDTVAAPTLGGVQPGALTTPVRNIGNTIANTIGNIGG